MPANETEVYREGYGMVPKSRAREIDAELAKQRKIMPNRTEIFDASMVERGSWVFRGGELIPRGEAMLQDIVKAHSKRGDHPAPMIMSDIEEYRNVIDGKPITSRSEHREFLKRHNVVEVGNEKVAPKVTGPAKGEIAREIKETIEQLEAGYINPDVGVLPKESDGFKGETVDVGNIKNGDYIRSDVTPDE